MKKLICLIECKSFQVPSRTKTQRCNRKLSDINKESWLAIEQKHRPGEKSTRVTTQLAFLTSVHSYHAKSNAGAAVTHGRQIRPGELYPCISKIPRGLSVDSCKKYNQLKSSSLCFQSKDTICIIHALTKHKCCPITHVSYRDGVSGTISSK